MRETLAAARLARNEAQRYDVQQALESGPKYFLELMEGLGADDGRALVLELDRLHSDGILGRGSNGEWLLKRRSS
jgi:hypothetical protein